MIKVKSTTQQIKNDNIVQPVPEKITLSTLSTDVSNTLQNVTKLCKEAYTLPTIEKVVLDKSESDKYSSDISSDDESSSSNSQNHAPQFSVKKIKEQNIILDREEKDSDIEREIEKLEKIKKKVDSATELLEKDLNDEKNNLSNYACVVRDDEFKLKKEREKREQEYSVYTSERDFTYEKIFKDFFVKKIINGWNNIPSLFMAKFPVYLFLNGMDIDGNKVRDDLLKTDDGFRLFKLLYSALTDNDFELPDDENDCEIVKQFMNTLPPIQIITERDIMDALENNDDNMFNQDETSQHSAEDDCDDKINMYLKNNDNKKKIDNF